MGTMVAVGQEGDMLDEDGHAAADQGDPAGRLDRGGGRWRGSTSSNTSYIESAAGVAEGARTGVANLVTGALFLLAMFLAPLVVVVPFEAASTALVVVGFLMMTAVRTIDWSDYEIAIPAFLTIVLMPFTYSISNGIGAGVITFVVIKLARARPGRSTRCCTGWPCCSSLYFLRGPIESLVLRRSGGRSGFPARLCESPRELVITHVVSQAH